MRTITFSSSVSNVSVSVTIYNDDILESTENFGNLVDPQSQATVSIMPNSANVDILNNYEVTIGFEQTTYSVNEGNVVEVCAVLTGTLNGSLEVFVKSSSGSATVAEDYNPVLETLTFGPTSNRTCFNFTTLEDEIFEEDIEDLNLHLTTMALNATLNPFLAYVHILDDDRAIGPTIPTVDSTTSNKQSNVFAIIVVASAVMLLVVAIMTIVIVMIAALRCCHSALDLQKNNRSEPLPAIELSSITGEALEEDLDSHAYDDIYSNSKPATTHPPTLPPLPASRNDEYELTTCPAYVPTNNMNSPSNKTKDGYYEIVVNTKPTIPPRMPVSRNGGYEITTCPAYAPPDIQNSPREETEDRL